jgi:UDP-N-acetyl-D-glucosamine dehydrogenase
MTKIGIVGQGYVGLPLAVAFASEGFNVTGFDIDVSRVSQLNSGISPIEDIESQDLNELIIQGNYLASSRPTDISDCNVVIIAVPTPLNRLREPDLSFVIAASEMIGEVLTQDSLIINESTSFPGTLRDVIAPTVTKKSLPGVEHTFAVSPERVDPGNLIWKISNTPRLIAGLTQDATLMTRKLYGQICENIIEVSRPEVAEAAKLFENTFRQVNIALVNEFATIMNALEIPTNEVLDAANTKPYGFMKFSPGLGVGGHCIPVDPSYLAFVASKAGVQPRFIELANEVNLHMPAAIVGIVKAENGGSLKGKSILICGVSYKPNIADTRETPARVLITELEAEGATVAWHDPVVESWNGQNSVSLDQTKYDATIITLHHGIFDYQAILNSSDYVFDCLGRIAGTHTL